MQKFRQLQEYIKNSDAILITAGAGIGVDSGLPDFRGDEGFWRAYPPIAKLGLSFEQMASPHWFDVDPKLAWAFYGHRLNLYRKTTPHEGFRILLDLTKEKNDNYFIFTSNVDGQFQKAGFNDKKIYEVHGCIHYMQCLKNCTDEIWDGGDVAVEVDMEKFEAKNIPLCSKCGAVLRPNILMFGDWGWNDKRAFAQEIRYIKWLKEIEKNAQQLSIIEIGAGCAIPTVRLESEKIAKAYQNAKLFRINPREYEVDSSIGFALPFGGLVGIKKLLCI